MIRYLYADQLAAYPRLSDSMFRDRADQFRTRLGWDVDVDSNGHERDAYDDLNPLYVIWEGADGRHRGSMRFLPTTGSTMTRDHFSHLLDGADIASPLIWECTRFCIARGAESRVAAALMLAGGEIMRRFGIEQFVGVFDARMIRIYQRIGACPKVLGSDGIGRAAISVGLWAYSEAARTKVAQSAQLPLDLSEQWFDQAFGAQPVALDLSA